MDVIKISLAVLAQPAVDTGVRSSGSDLRYDATELADTHLRGEVVIDSDDPVAVPFGHLESATVVFLVSDGDYVEAELDTADLANQVVSLEPFYGSVNVSTPVTGITLSRTLGGGTVRVAYLLGAPAS